jgi:hypothetical protein
MKLSLPITIGCLLLTTAFLGAQDYRRADTLSHRVGQPHDGADTGGTPPQGFNPLLDDDRAMRARKMAQAFEPEIGAALPM